MHKREKMFDEYLKKEGPAGPMIQAALAQVRSGRWDWVEAIENLALMLAHVATGQHEVLVEHMKDSCAGIKWFIKGADGH